MIYINENGTALSDYTLFEGAERAVIINADSKELPVLRILGANSMYDIVKFNTETDKKTIALKSASQPASVGETVYLLPYSTQKAATCQTGTVTKVDTIGDKAYYYTLAIDNQRKNSKLPYYECQWRSIRFNPKKNASDEAKESYAIGATYGASLSITALSLNDMSLNKNRHQKRTARNRRPKHWCTCSWHLHNKIRTNISPH